MTTTKANVSNTGQAVEGKVLVDGTWVRVIAYGSDWFDAVATFGREVEAAYGHAAIAGYAAGHMSFDRKFSWMHTEAKAGKIEVR